ncbi:unnamed protein product, partial [Owenia fusiformis]
CKTVPQSGNLAKPVKPYAIDGRAKWMKPTVSEDIPKTDNLPKSSKLGNATKASNILKFSNAKSSKSFSSGSHEIDSEQMLPFSGSAILTKKGSQGHEKSYVQQRNHKPSLSSKNKYTWRKGKSTDATKQKTDTEGFQMNDHQQNRTDEQTYERVNEIKHPDSEDHTFKSKQVNVPPGGNITNPRASSNTSIKSGLQQTSKYKLVRKDSPVSPKKTLDVIEKKTQQSNKISGFDLDTIEHPTVSIDKRNVALPIETRSPNENSGSMSTGKESPISKYKIVRNIAPSSPYNLSKQLQESRKVNYQGERSGVESSIHDPGMENSVQSKKKGVSGIISKYKYIRQNSSSNQTANKLIRKYQKGAENFDNIGSHSSESVIEKLKRKSQQKQSSRVKRLQQKTNPYKLNRNDADIVKSPYTPRTIQHTIRKGKNQIRTSKNTMETTKHEMSCSRFKRTKGKDGRNSKKFKKKLDKTWVSKYSLQRNKEDEGPSLNAILGRKVTNKSKNKFKFVKAHEKQDSCKMRIDRRKHSQGGKVSKQTASSSQPSLVMISGTVYRRSACKLSRQTSKDKVYNSSIRPGSRKRTLSGSISIHGSRYRIDSSGKSLKKLKPKNQSVQSDNGRISRINIGGSSYTQSTPGTLVKTPSARHKLANRVLHKSIATVSKFKQDRRNERFCIFYNRFGRCNRGEKCPFVHDPKRIAVCTRFLRGTCQVDNCPFSHTVAMEKMPVCAYFLRGVCTKDSCPYLHVNVGKEAKICQDFIKGYCRLADKCKKRHVLICEEFRDKGTCSKGNKCEMIHQKPREGAKRARYHDPIPSTSTAVSGTAESSTAESSTAKSSSAKSSTANTADTVTPESDSEDNMKGRNTRHKRQHTSESSSENLGYSNEIPSKKRFLPSYIALTSATSSSEELLSTSSFEEHLSSASTSKSEEVSSVSPSKVDLIAGNSGIQIRPMLRLKDDQTNFDMTTNDTT